MKRSFIWYDQLGHAISITSKIDKIANIMVATTTYFAKFESLDDIVDHEKTFHVVCLVSLLDQYQSQNRQNDRQHGSHNNLESLSDHN